MNKNPSVPSMPLQEVTIENGAILRVEGLLAQLNAKKLFFVVDKPAFEYSGAATALNSCLNSLEVTLFSDFELNPKIEDVERGVELFQKTTPDVVMGLGGGSALDMAKLVAGCGGQAEPPIEYATGRRSLTGFCPPIIAIPTTSGTGSEATHFAVVYVGGQKFSLAHPFLLADYVIIDPELTYSLPPRTTASCGLDALCQSIESIWAVGSTLESIEYATNGLRLALDHLETAVGKPDPESRMAMARAAHLSGKAININKTTAPHAISYAITTGFQVPHGMAVALTLGAFLDYNYQVDEASCTDPRGAGSVKRRIDRIVKELGDGSKEQARERLRSVMKSVGSPLRLHDVGINENDLSGLVKQVNAERLSNNPRKIHPRGLLSLLKSIL